MQTKKDVIMAIDTNLENDIPYRVSIVCATDTFYYR